MSVSVYQETPTSEKAASALRLFSNLALSALICTVLLIMVGSIVRVTGFGLPKAELDAVIEAGIAFRTSGCPGKVRDDVSACDRPYGDSPPSDIASYPFQPAGKDLRKIRRQLDLPKTRR